MDAISKARAMKCFGMKTIVIESDPDPEAQHELTAEYNCQNCDSYEYCFKLADVIYSTKGG